MNVTSLQEYIETIQTLEKNYTYELKQSPFQTQIVKPSFIFRGQSKNSYELIPGILRHTTLPTGTIKSNYSQFEYDILDDFISEAAHYIKDIPINDTAAWLEIAQHFGVPTRLLDFTQNPLVALYFACYNNNDDEASVWIINEPAYRRVLMHDYTYISAQNSKMIISKIINDEIISQDYRPHNNDHYIQHPWIYKPVYREARMVSQSSVFMLWAAKRSSITSFISDEHYMSLQVSDSLREYGFICQITIPAQCKGNILHQLNSCGINEKFIYPGLDGVGKFIRNKYSNTR